METPYLETHDWKIVERGWRPEKQKASESIFSLGNGFMGQRANFEEDFTGESLQGSYLGGVYFPDKTRVGWWKNGYPEYFAKVINSVNWIGIRVKVDGIPLDLAQLQVSDFYRELNLREGYLLRRFRVEIAPGKEVAVEAQRFLSMKRKEIGAIRYSLKLLDFQAPVQWEPYLDFDVYNSDSNYEEQFWERVSEQVGSQKAVVESRTKKLDFRVAAAMRYQLLANGEYQTLYPDSHKSDQYAENTFGLLAEANQEYSLEKYAAIVSNFQHPHAELSSLADERAREARSTGFDALREEQKEDWAQRWAHSDIVIEGDPQAQQGIRFNIFQLHQTYTGEDPRLNIGPKGFTGEKYGGSTYWDTEAYCLPFYMATAGQEVARNLLIYRYKHLGKAIENAEKLGFTGGAALYPMVTMNGEECHNEWEITFEEIHRNGAIAYAIFNYVRYFDEPQYLVDYGLEVLLAIARFWAQRFHWSEAKSQYVMLGVTGPNEYENNVHNNWYTNYIARWCFQYAGEAIEKVGELAPERLEEIFTQSNFSPKEERAHWEDIVQKIYLPWDEERQIYLQQEGYLDKLQQTAPDLEAEERPINQHWSWDRILRSCFIKQADVLQGFYFFREHFSTEEMRRHFDFYEPRTLHESSLSPCVHVVLATQLERLDKAYDLYLRTSRLDLDDYNREVGEGLHITSMAGTWLSVTEGFGGMQVEEEALHFRPQLPKGWKSLSFQIIFRGSLLQLRFTKDSSEVKLLSGSAIKVLVHGKTLLS